MTTQLDLTAYVRAGYPAIWLLTPEEARAEHAILEVAKEMKRRMRIWSHTEGLYTPDPNNPEREDLTDPIEALEKIKREHSDGDQGTIYVFRDLHPFFRAPKVTRLVRDICRKFKRQRKHLVILSPVGEVPPELERDLSVVEFPMPGREDIERIWGLLYDTNQVGLGEIEPDETDRIVQAALGLTTVEAESAFAKACVEHARGNRDDSISTLVLREKAAMVNKAGVLEYYQTQTTMDDIGGLESLKHWLQLRRNVFSRNAREYGLPSPRGILLVGLPGCGKCVKHDTLVVADGVLQRIGSLSSHRDTSKPAPLDVAVESAESVERATEFHWVGTNPTKRITLSNGMQLEGRPVHPVRVIDHCGDLVWREMGDIEVGDCVVAKLGARLANEAEVLLPQPTQEHCNEKLPCFPRSMGVGFAYWLGLMFGDGSFSDTGFSFIQDTRGGSAVVLSRFIGLLDTCFGLKDVTVSYPENRGGYIAVVQVGSKPLVRCFAEMGVTSAKERIPDVVLAAGRRCVEAFVAGLWDADGSMNQNGSLEITQKRQALMRDLQCVLWTLGVPCGLSPKPVTVDGKELIYWRLTVVGGSRSEAFGNVVARMAHTDKVERYVFRSDENGSGNASRFGDYECLRDRVVEMWQSARPTVGMKKAKFVLHQDNGFFSHCTFWRMMRMIGERCYTANRRFLEWMYSDGVPLRVTEVEDCEAEVCDIGVPTNSTFVGNGIVCHNSLSAKASSHMLDMPLVRFDVGRVFDSLVGASEANMRRAIGTVEAVGQCVLWIDELDKAFAGVGDARTGDSGTSQRCFGNFVTWMQEHESPTFLVATVNRIDGLPPELLRKGRFDEIFYVGLPSAVEREAILRIHIAKYGREPENFYLDECVEASEGFSGSEIEFAVRDGLYNSYHHGRELDSADILRAMRVTNPLSQSKGPQLLAMAAWAEDNAVNASGTREQVTLHLDDQDVSGSAGRRLDLDDESGDGSDDGSGDGDETED